MITKKQLGLGMSAVGFVAFLAILAIDFLKAGKFEGIGPTQQIALIGAGLLMLLGLTLIPLGNKPA